MKIRIIVDRIGRERENPHRRIRLKSICLPEYGPCKSFFHIVQLIPALSSDEIIY